KIGMSMWRTAADCWYDKEGKAAEDLAERDGEMDDLQTVLVSEVAASKISSAAAMELALVARFYERLGDHAVNIARMVGAMHDDLGRD
ncbi:MAG TPA: PhoU domain-containing protein, partial [Acidimicrobiales bacterium]|nr:PhoU domain-containing protein [Acidimicrobiales bacterium]